MVGSEMILCTVCGDVAILAPDSPVVFAAEIIAFIDAHIEHADCGLQVHLNYT
jgi:hypothetical protein